MLIILILFCCLDIRNFANSQITVNPKPQPHNLHLPYVTSCCPSINATSNDLFLCLNRSSYLQLSDVLSHTNVNPTNVLVGVVTYATANIWDYAAYALAVNEAYAENNGYAMILLDRSTSNYEPKDARWNKVKILEKALDQKTGWARNMDYVMWVDADMIFLDMGLRLEKIAAAYPDAHILISAEHAGSSTLVNSGSILVRNSKWSRQFLSDWWTHANRTFHSDQEQFDLLYHSQKIPRQFDKFIAILPPDALNSDPPAMTKQRPHNQVLHLMGEHTAFRIRAFKTAFSTICNFHTARSGSLTSKPSAALPPLPIQLGITQTSLLTWTIEEYSQESEPLLVEYETSAQKGTNGLEPSRRLSNAVHHWAHALEYRQATGDADLAAHLRTQVFELLLINLQHKRQENVDHRQDTGRMLSDWPEMIKNVAEAGQHLLQLGDLTRRKNVAQTVMNLLQELLKACHREQRKAVMAMVAHMHSEIGLIALSDDDLPRAVKHFHISVNISEEIADASGEHLLVTPMSNLANALSMQGKLDRSIPIFERIIGIAERHLGPRHESLSQLLVNCGIALVQADRRAEAQKTLRRAIKIMSVNNEPRNSVLYERAREYLAKATARDL